MGVRECETEDTACSGSDCVALVMAGGFLIGPEIGVDGVGVETRSVVGVGAIGVEMRPVVDVDAVDVEI